LATFFIHWNRIRKRVVIHRPQYGACNNGAGMHRGKIAAGRGDTYDWIKHKSYDDAVFQATGLNVVIGTKWKNCGICHPQLFREISN
jgi:hypothetical protein